MRVVSGSQGFRLVEFNSDCSGPTVCIIGGVHGDETFGAKLITTLERKFALENLLLRGRLLTLIANLEAVQCKKRFIDCDLNRAFGNSVAFGHEAQLAQRLKPYLADLDYVLDLHSTSAPTQAFCAGVLTSRHLEVFDATGLEFYTHGWEIHRGYTMLIDEVNRLGGVGVVAECGKTGDSQTYVVGYNVVLRFLQKLEIISPFTSQFPTNRTIVQINQIVTAKTSNFFFTRHFENFDLVEANEVVAYDNEQPINFLKEFVMVMPTRSKLKPGEEAFGMGIINKLKVG